MPPTAQQVADPDELEKQQGVRSLSRRSSALTAFGSVPSAERGGTEPAVLTAWASCLQRDWEADLGAVLQPATESFVLL